MDVNSGNIPTTLEPKNNNLKKNCLMGILVLEFLGARKTIFSIFYR
jgi:hypothetical protein